MATNDVIGLVKAILSADTAEFTKKFDTAADDVKKLADRLKKDLEPSQRAINTAVRDFLGGPEISRANTYAAAIEKIGDVSKLTEADQKKVNRAMQDALAHYKALGETAPANLVKIEEATRKAEKSTGLLEGQWLKLTAAITSGALIGKGISFLTDFAGEIVTTAGNLVDLSAQTGLSTKALQIYGTIAQATGSDVNTVADAVFKLGLNLEEGSEKTEAAVKRLGLNINELLRLSPEEQFEAIAEKLHDVETATERNRLGVDLFGKAWKEVGPAVVEGLKSIEDQTVLVADASLKAIDEMADAWSKFYDDTLKKAMSWAGAQVSLYQNLPKIYELERQGSPTARALSDEYFRGNVDPVDFAARVASFLGTYGKDVNLPTEGGPGRKTQRQIDDENRAREKATDELKRFRESAAKAGDWLTDIVNKTRVQGFKIGEGLPLYNALYDPDYQQKFQQMDVNRLLASAFDQLERFRMQDAAAWMKSTTSKPFSISQVPGTSVTLGTPPPGPGFFGQAFGGNFGTQAASTVLGAAMGGGNMAGSLGSLTGGAIAGQAAKAVTKAIGGKIGSMVGSVIPVVGGILGELAGNAIGSLFGGGKGAKANDLRDQLKQQMGGDAAGKGLASQIASMVADSAKFGVDSGNLKALEQKFLTAGKPAEVEAAANALQAALQKQAKAIQEVQQLVGKYGLAMEDLLSPQERARKSIDAFAADFKKLKDLGFGDAKIGKAMAAGLNDVVDAALVAGTKLPEAFRPLLQDLATSGGLTEDLKNKLLGIDAVKVPWQEMKGIAEEFGISLEALGPKFQQAQLTDQAAELGRKFELLVINGADVQAVVDGMSTAANDFVKAALKWGLEVPPTLKPLLDKMAEQGKLTDENGDKLEDLSKIKFGQTLADQLDPLLKKLDELIDVLSNKLPNALGTAGRAADTAATNRPTVEPGAVVEVPSFASGSGGLRDFTPKGTWARLHAREEVLTQRQGEGVAAMVSSALAGGESGKPLNINLIQDGRVTARVVARYLPDAVKEYKV